jgi:hypothetical protein
MEGIMKIIYFKSLKIDMTGLKGKEFKLLADLTRSGVKNLHGFRAQKGLTDSRLRQKPIKIHFKTTKDRAEFNSLLKSLLNDKILNEISLIRTTPRNNEKKPYRFVRVK